MAILYSKHFFFYTCTSFEMRLAYINDKFMFRVSGVDGPGAQMRPQDPGGPCHSALFPV